MISGRRERDRADFIDEAAAANNAAVSFLPPHAAHAFSPIAALANHNRFVRLMAGERVNREIPKC
jgi:hypothetical protein